MNILVIGGAGKLGKAVMHEGALRKHVLMAPYHNRTIRFSLDITNHAECIQQIVENDWQPRLVINCSAYNNVDGAETGPGRSEAYATNSIGPANLASACALAKIPLVHVSTDYVFDGFDRGRGAAELIAYKEITYPNPLSQYGISKFLGEINVGTIQPESWVFRTSGLFGINGEGLPLTIFREMKKNRDLNFSCDSVFCPTWAPELARVIFDCVEKPVPFGIYHACGESCSPYALANRVAACFDWSEHSFKINAVSMDEANKGRFAKRPRLAAMFCGKLIAAHVTPPQGITVISSDMFEKE